MTHAPRRNTPPSLNLIMDTKPSGFRLKYIRSCTANTIHLKKTHLVCKVKKIDFLQCGAEGARTMVFRTPVWRSMKTCSVLLSAALLQRIVSSPECKKTNLSLLLAVETRFECYEWKIFANLKEVKPRVTETRKSKLDSSRKWTKTKKEWKKYRIINKKKTAKTVVVSPNFQRIREPLEICPDARIHHQKKCLLWMVMTFGLLSRTPEGTARIWKQVRSQAEHKGGCFSCWFIGTMMIMVCRVTQQPSIPGSEVDLPPPKLYLLFKLFLI